MSLRFFILIALSCLLHLFSYGQAEQKPNMIKGVCWVSGDSITDHNMDHLVNNHVNWISQTPFGLMRGHDNPKIEFSSESYDWGESDLGLIHTSVLAHRKGIKVMLKPHIWIRAANGKWRSDIAMNSPLEWEAWFSSYADFMLHYARVAEDGQMDALCIGAELYLTTKLFPEKWIELIQEIRKVYKGKLTYAANFYKEYEEVTFWNHLDAIGIQGYFPLSKNQNPTKDELIQGWQVHIDNMKKVSEKYGKPIIFTEIGYRNSADAAIEPWLWPRQLGDSFQESNETQAVCLDAMFESLWNESWFDGVYIWKWFRGSYEYSQEEFYQNIEERRNQSVESGRYDKARIGFSPQNKEGELVIRRWFEESPGGG